MAEQHKLIYPIKHFRDFLENEIRLDGRTFDKYRPIGVNIASCQHSLGSSATKIGNSNILCGIRAELSKPRASKPLAGYIVPNVDMSFTAFSKASSSTNNQNVSEILECFIYRILYESHCLKLEDLCIHPGKLVWCLYIDIIGLEVDGGVFDASVLACASALSTLSLPIVTYDEKSGKIEIGDDTKKLHLNIFPVVSTYSIFDNVVLVDPTYREESISSTVFHLGVHEDTVGLFHKSGGVPISLKEIQQSVKNAVHREKEITSLLNSLKTNQ
ncbi:PREDICTED: exosome complex component RRP43-like isoform X1 [Bactrocera latifrons]|uniref:Ribosomal RNA-processing protein 43 n=2 Tax=Bactrocera latifrons TaxID=174628 RepID=A0A0K8W5W5_BACLA|nr:PREDICTED: exosome complex component RRP43-like isoform X1 [Bactrocera latifrons]XP_018794978.1 PREDICTED: exosome complex component RRP43-like isoform X1 [Bactrocera latifrons]